MIQHYELIRSHGVAALQSDEMPDGAAGLGQELLEQIVSGYSICSDAGYPPVEKQYLAHLFLAQQHLSQHGLERAAEASALLVSAAAGLETLNGPGDPNALGCRRHVAQVKAKQGDIAAARPLYEAALVTATQHFGASCPDTLEMTCEWADVLAESGEAVEAAALYKTVLGHIADNEARREDQIQLKIKLAKLGGGLVHRGFCDVSKVTLLLVAGAESEWYHKVGAEYDLHTNEWGKLDAVAKAAFVHVRTPDDFGELESSYKEQ
jgi:hypothetical protein